MIFGEKYGNINNEGSSFRIPCDDSVINGLKYEVCMEHLIKRIIQFRNDRDWKQFHSPENLAKSISIEAGELLEKFQWSSDFDLEEVKEELADVINYCIQMAIVLDLDIVEIVNEKIDKNEVKYPVSKAKGTCKKYTDL